MEIQDKIAAMHISHPKLKAAVTETEEAMARWGIPIGNVLSVTVNTRYSSRWGQCRKVHLSRKVRTADRPGGYYEIEISPALLQEDVPYSSLLNTVVHEYLHTIEGCMNHGPLWKRYAQYLNIQMGLDIARTNSSSELGVQEKETKYKYALMCTNCHTIIRRQKMSELVKNPQNYRCRCGGRLQRIV